MVLPSLPPLKEWVYAGMIYEMAGALFSDLVVGDGNIKSVIVPPNTLVHGVPRLARAVAES